MSKIYIIGPVGSGKTTLARTLSKKLNIKYHELDKIVWDDDAGNRKRNPVEIKKLFDDILNDENWIIEDVGRDIFKRGISEADIVYYLDLAPTKIYIRITTRWIKQKLHLETYNYRPTLKGLKEMYKWAQNDLLKKDEKIYYIKENSKEYRIIK